MEAPKSKPNYKSRHTPRYRILPFLFFRVFFLLNKPKTAIKRKKRKENFLGAWENMFSTVSSLSPERGTIFPH